MLYRACFCSGFRKTPAAEPPRLSRRKVRIWPVTHELWVCSISGYVHHPVFSAQHKGGRMAQGRTVSHPALQLGYHHATDARPKECGRSNASHSWAWPQIALTMIQPTVTGRLAPDGRVCGGRSCSGMKKRLCVSCLGVEIYLLLQLSPAFPD